MVKSAPVPRFPTAPSSRFRIPGAPGPEIRCGSSYVLHRTTRHSPEKRSRNALGLSVQAPSRNVASGEVPANRVQVGFDVCARRVYWDPHPLCTVRCGGVRMVGMSLRGNVKSKHNKCTLRMPGDGWRCAAGSRELGRDGWLRFQQDTGKKSNMAAACKLTITCRGEKKVHLHQRANLLSASLIILSPHLEPPQVFFHLLVAIRWDRPRPHIPCTTPRLHKIWCD